MKSAAACLELPRARRFDLYIIAVFIGPFMTVSAVWTIADIFNGLMAIPNLIALVALNGVIVAETRSYFKRLNSGQIRE